MPFLHSAACAWLDTLPHCLRHACTAAGNYGIAGGNPGSGNAANINTFGARRACMRPLPAAQLGCSSSRVCIVLVLWPPAAPGTHAGRLPASAACHQCAHGGSLHGGPATRTMRRPPSACCADAGRQRSTAAPIWHSPVLTCGCCCARAATIYSPSQAVGARWSGLLADSGLDRLYHSGAHPASVAPVCLMEAGRACQPRPRAVQAQRRTAVMLHQLRSVPLCWCQSPAWVGRMGPAAAESKVQGWRAGALLTTNGDVLIVGSEQTQDYT